MVIIDSQCAREVGLVFAAKQLHHVTKVSQAIVDGCCGQEIESFRSNTTVEQIIESVIPGPIVTAAVATGIAGIPEMMRFIDDYDVGEFRHPPETFWE